MDSSPTPPLGWKVLYYIYPTTVFAFFAASMLLSSILLRKPKQTDKPKTEAATRRPLLALVFCLLSTYVAQIILLAVDSIIQGEWLVDDPTMVGYLSCVLVYGTQLTMINDTTGTISHSFHGSWFFALPFELTIGVLNLMPILSTMSFSTLHVILVILPALRCLSLTALVGWSLLRLYFQQRYFTTDEERQRLLSKVANQTQTENEAGYGATEQANDSSNDRIESTWERLDREAREAMEKRFEEGGGNWLAYVKDYMVCLVFTISALPNLPPFLLLSIRGDETTASESPILHVESHMCVLWLI